MFQNKIAQTWAARLDRFDQSETTIAQFCLQEGVSQASYYYWRRKLRTQSPASKQKQASPVPPFLPVTLPSQQATIIDPATTIPSRMTIELPGGIRIRFEIPTDHHPADQAETRP